MKDETRELTIPVRVSFTEKRKIVLRAKRVQKTISEFMRQSSLRM